MCLESVKKWFSWTNLVTLLFLWTAGQKILQATLIQQASLVAGQGSAKWTQRPTHFDPWPGSVTQQRKCSTGFKGFMAYSNAAFHFFQLCYKIKKKISLCNIIC